MTSCVESTTNTKWITAILIRYRENMVSSTATIVYDDNPHKASPLPWYSCTTNCTYSIIRLFSPPRLSIDVQAWPTHLHRDFLSYTRTKPLDTLFLPFKLWQSRLGCSAMYTISRSIVASAHSTLSQLPPIQLQISKQYSTHDCVHLLHELISSCNVQLYVYIYIYTSVPGPKRNTLIPHLLSKFVLWINPDGVISFQCMWDPETGLKSLLKTLKLVWVINYCEILKS